MRMRQRATAFVAMVGIFSAGVAPAASAGEDRLQVDLRTDLRVTLGLMLLTGTVEAFREQLAPDLCRWCDRDAAGNPSLNPMDDWARKNLVWNDLELADSISDYTAYWITPAIAFGLEALIAEQNGALSNWPADALVVAESVMAAAALTALLKVTLARERPFVLDLPADHPFRDEPDDFHLSFPSGHTSHAFAMVVSSGTVASLRGYRGARWIWIAGLPAAAATGYLRIAADQHYLTDVLAGAAIGSASGFLVPYVFHRKRVPARAMPHSAGFVPLRGGAAANVLWRW
jgi:membrane-associated phospholipid phosphatase